MGWEGHQRSVGAMGWSKETHGHAGEICVAREGGSRLVDNERRKRDNLAPGRAEKCGRAVELAGRDVRKAPLRWWGKAKRREGSGVGHGNREGGSSRASDG